MDAPPPTPTIQSIKVLRALLLRTKILFAYYLSIPSTVQPPGKAAFLPYLQSPPPFLLNLRILCVLFVYVSAMVCV